MSGALDTVLLPTPQVTKPPADDPLWYRDAVIYQLHVKSFFDSTNDGCGDFLGLSAKLDYLVELGIDTIWLLPFYPSPRLDDGYDIADYRAVHPDYGDIEDVRAFIEQAHARGLRVITELVINHTSDQHPWFQRARRAPAGSKERDWYVWSDSDQRYTGTRIIFCDTEPSNWTWDPVAGAFYWHRFYSHQPDLNFDNPQVLEEVIEVMRFWLDMGIDGLRLDAVPYLIEREGTSNENLPETHAVLKKIRTALDASYTNRMLLAEANQWPEDVQEYFGKGDECHMAFHFPLMPRMYMAIAQEDRFPITDIMRQTPAIPDTCQWVIFLRNHDELTLEMVTDRERDYLWQTYAIDRRARLNLGIRRRLAPLLERDRRRIELMNCLLLSMPGTPVIYYGDEIGMGDNIHLGDRDGVRTPMQWSPDRNGGFSKCDPEQLVLPPLMGPLYGFEVVNAESQSRDLHSLLNWMRRMLATRKLHPAFGRGSIRFLHPGNRKVLAYVREYEAETLLCVANLSRSPQAVELDLVQYAGRIPVELSGHTAFPRIGQLTYLLTLPPYGFYWFRLCTDVQAPSGLKGAPEPLPEYATLVLRKGIEDALAANNAHTLTHEILPAYLPKRRWFGAHGKPPSKIAIKSIARLPGGPSEIMLAQIELGDSQPAERYCLPFGVHWEEDITRALPQQLALARVRVGRRVGLLTDGFALESFVRHVFQATRDRAVFTASDGSEYRFLPMPAIEELPLSREVPVRWLSAEQSNSSVQLNESVIIKLVRRVRMGVHPQTEMTRYLSTTAFRSTPALLGEVQHVCKGVSATIGIVERYVPNEGDAWAWTLEYLRRTINDLAVTGVSRAEVHQEFAAYRAFIANVGKRLAELHAALSQPNDDPAFEPKQSSAQDLRRWGSDVARELESALAELKNMKEWPDPATQERASALLAAKKALVAEIRRLAAAGVGALKTRVHGDFHLGQVLVAQTDAWLIDFEGEPARPLEERRAHSSPLRDVAGLLRSLDYAAHVSAAQNMEGNAPAIQERAQKLTQRFLNEAREAFLAAYRAVAAQTPHPWASPEAAAALTDLFLLGKAAYEIRYELGHRPAWLGIPVKGLFDLAARMKLSAREEISHEEIGHV